LGKRNSPAAFAWVCPDIKDFSLATHDHRPKNGDNSIAYRLGIFILDLPGNHPTPACLKDNMAGVLIVTDHNRAGDARNTALLVGLYRISGLGNLKRVFACLVHHERE
jgi:hypothetical protein